MAVSKGASVQITGLSELRQKLAGLNLTDELKDANEYVAEYVVDKAEPRMRGLGAMGARAAMTMKATRSGVAARISGGSDSVPFFSGVEFGAVRGVPRSSAKRQLEGWNQFQPWRGSGQDAGYALYPTIRSSASEIARVYEKEIDRILRPAFPD